MKGNQQFHAESQLPKASWKRLQKVRSWAEHKGDTLLVHTVYVDPKTNLRVKRTRAVQ